MENKLASKKIIIKFFDFGEWKIKKEHGAQHCVCVHSEQKLATPHTRDRWLQAKINHNEKTFFNCNISTDYFFLNRSEFKY